MKSYSYYILLCLLAIFIEPVLAQKSIETKSQPDFPVLPFLVTFTATPAGGTVAVSISDNQLVSSNTTIHNKTLVTLTTIPTDKYKPATGYPKVHKTGDDKIAVPLSPAIDKTGVYTFTMPSHPVSIDMQYTARSANANLSELKYKIGNDEEVTISDFSSETITYDIILPDDTDPKAIITLSGTKENEFASLPSISPTVTLSDGKGSATLYVTAEDGTEQAYTLNFTVPKYPIDFKAPANGELSLTSDGEVITNGSMLFKGTKVTMKTTPKVGFIAQLGYPNIYFLQNETKKQYPIEVVDGVRTFIMPSFPITLEMEYVEIPSNDARLKSLGYKMRDEGDISVPGFNSGKTSYQIMLPFGTTSDATIEFINECTDSRAVVTCTPATLTLNEGKGSVKLKVTANDKKTKQEYTVDFTVATENTHIVIIDNTIEGGTISATYIENEKVQIFKSGDVVASNTELTLSYTSLPGYKFESYTGETISGNKVTIAKGTTLSATFIKEAGELPPIIGTEAKAETPDDDPLPQPDAPIVIFSDAGALPTETVLSELRLIKDEPTKENSTRVEEVIRNQNITADNMEIMEITLVKVTTAIDGKSGEISDIKIIPVQPSDKVKVRIPYPAGKNKESHDFTVIHLKSDGTTETYTVANGGLSLLDRFMELTVYSFSPFGITWVKKADSTPPPTTVYHNVLLPDMEGVIFNRISGKNTVEEGEDFSFSLIIQDGYKLYSDPIVHIDRNNEIIIPNTSNGDYLIRNIDRDITVTIRGINKDPSIPTDNEVIENGTRVRSAASKLYIHTDHSQLVTIFTLSGKAIQKFMPPAGDSQYTLSRGMYLVVVGKDVFKVMIH